MKKLKTLKNLKKAYKAKRFVSNNKIALVALAGAVAGLAVTYLLETEKGRSLLGSLSTTVKNLAARLTPAKPAEAA